MSPCSNLKLIAYMTLSLIVERDILSLRFLTGAWQRMAAVVQRFSSGPDGAIRLS